MPVTLVEDIEKQNQEYYARLAQEKVSFAADARERGNTAIAAEIDADGSDGLVVSLNICINSCGFVIADADAQGNHRLRKASAREAYNRWNWSDMSLATADNLLASAAIGHIDPHEVFCVLCAPSMLSDQDLEIFGRCMNVVLGQGGECFSYESDAPVSVCMSNSAEAPTWARSLAAKNCVRAIAKDIIVSEKMIVIAGRYAYGYKDELEIADSAIVKSLLRGTGVEGGLFANEHVEPPSAWQRDALARVGLSPRDCDELRRIVDIVQLWTAICSNTSVVSRMSVQDLQDPDVVADKLHYLGNAISIDAFIRGYIAGIPLSDLVDGIYDHKKRHAG